MHEAEVQRLVTLDALHAEIARSPGRGAAARLHAIIADGPAPTRSELEDAMLALLKRHGLPRPEVNARIGADEVDLYFPGSALVVELDGWRYHGTRVRHRLDADKQARLRGRRPARPAGRLGAGHRERDPDRRPAATSTRLIGVSCPRRMRVRRGLDRATRAATPRATTLATLVAVV